MERFIDSEEYTRIKNELEYDGVLRKEFYFECYDSRVFTFGITHDMIYHELNFIANETISKQMSVEEIINFKSISFFCHRVFLIDEKGQREFSGSLSWAQNRSTIIFN